MAPKPWYASKTVWFNILGIAVIVAQQFGYGEHVVDETWQALALTLVNLFLRFRTRRPIG